MTTWISVYARSPREGVLLDVKLSDGRTWRGATWRYKGHVGYAVTRTNYACSPACVPCKRDERTTVTHFRGHES
jgi:hypothetical protein